MSQNQIIFVLFFDNNNEYNEDHQRVYLGIFSNPGLAMQVGLADAKERCTAIGLDYMRKASLDIVRQEVDNVLASCTSIPLYTSGHWLWDVINIDIGA